jgi:N-acetylmuramoyl-L-alanine amidase
VRLLANSHRSAGFAVLKAPDIPSALVELGALSNRDEEHALKTPAYRQKLALSLARSVNDYFDFVVKV